MVVQVMMVLTSLCEECTFLKNVAEVQLYSPLHMFGALPGKEDEEAFEAGLLVCDLRGCCAVPRVLLRRPVNSKI
jgi:hypothetical protein